MATTTNFGWETPDDTDLVKDGAAAIRTALGGVDTSFVDLKGGTTGQVLSKASNTDLDYTWVTTNDANAIQNAIVDAKGDLIAASAADTPARLAVGSNYEFLNADSTAATGLAWAGNYVSYTPTLTNMTQGNGTVTAKYLRIGKSVNVYFRFVLGSTSSVSTFPYFSLPFSAASGVTSLGWLELLDSGTATYFGVCKASGGNGLLAVANTAGTYMTGPDLSATVPMTWTTNDAMTATLTYEVG